MVHHRATSSSGRHHALKILRVATGVRPNSASRGSQCADLTGNSCGRTCSPNAASASRISTCYRTPPRRHRRPAAHPRPVPARPTVARNQSAPEPPSPSRTHGCRRRRRRRTILLSEQGILLDRRRLSTLELPGGRVEAGDCVKDAVVRELAEQAGLVTRAEDAVLLGTLVDHVAGVLRVTVGAGRPHLAGAADHAAERERRRLVVVPTRPAPRRPVRLQCPDPHRLAARPSHRTRDHRSTELHHQPSRDEGTARAPVQQMYVPAGTTARGMHVMRASQTRW
ncbi:NUDIX hydrolase [Streptomyces anulatus]|uniref:NUDIX hydrolase n=1 Tax=Streptomyces anulatus TaxID=1892 RepID=UPI0031FD72E9